MERASGSAKKVSIGMGFTGSMDSAAKTAEHSRKATTPLQTIAFIIGAKQSSSWRGRQLAIGQTVHVFEERSYAACRSGAKHGAVVRTIGGRFVGLLTIER
jgi:hypothetical protein